MKSKALVQHEKLFALSLLRPFYKLNVDGPSCRIVGLHRNTMSVPGVIWSNMPSWGMNPVLLKSIIAADASKGRPFVFRKGGRADKGYF